jgi:tetrahydromethanopterin S-methyltransferase subunit G
MRIESDSVIKKDEFDKIEKRLSSLEQNMKKIKKLTLITTIGFYVCFLLLFFS